MVHDTGQIGIRKRDAPVRILADDIAWGRFSIAAEKESGLRAEISVSPAIQNDSSDIVFGMES